MKLRVYDVLSHLIPGLIIYFFVIFIFRLDESWQQFLPAMAFSMAIGYIVNIFSSWLSPFYYWTWGGKPSNQLLRGTDIPLVRFHNKDEVSKRLHDQYPGKSDEALFEIAYTMAKEIRNDHIQVFSENYGYARSMLTTGILTAMVLLIGFYEVWWIWTLILIFVFILWNRARERAFYFAKEVLLTYLKSIS